MTPRQRQAVDALAACGGNKTRAARQLGIARATLQELVGKAEWAHGRPPVAPQEPEPPPRDPVRDHLESKFKSQAQRERKALLDRLALAEEQVRFLGGITGPLPPATIRPREPVSGKREATAVALASDWHVEETVEPEKVEGLNRYDLSIAEQRIGRFFEGFEWLIGYHRQAFTVRDAILWLGGDLLSGYIHEELMEGNALSPTETVLFLRQKLRDGIKGLLRDSSLERLVIPCNYGNHGRTGDKKRIATGAQNSFEWLLYNVLAGDFLEEPRVRFIVADGEHAYVDVYNFTLHFTHGDSVNYGGGVGGISIPVNKAVASWNTVKRAHYHNFGHFHQRLEGRDWNGNGSLIGYSPYAFHVKAQFEPPQQSFYLVDSKYGRCMSTPIWVGEKAEAA